MKNYLKIKVFISLLFLISISSCSKDDTETISGGVEIKYLSTLESNIGPTDYPRYARKDTLVYENDKVIKSFIGSGCDPSVYQYEYGTNGKISKIYVASFNPMGYPNVEDLITMFETSTINVNSENNYILEYDTKKRLNSIQGNYSSVQFEYDNEGRLYKKITEDITYTVVEFDDKGNPLYLTRDYEGSVSDRYYSYGNLKNPYYDLFEKYGLVDIDCALGDSFITPNVITKSGMSNITFKYNSDEEYPSSVNYELNGFRSIYNFSYR